MNALSIPLDMHGPHGFDGGFSVLPFVSVLLFLLLLAGLATFYLWRHGKITLPDLGRRTAPEDEAKQILADRFARGDISTEDFMERSSVLNWTPGSDPAPARRPRAKRR